MPDRHAATPRPRVVRLVGVLAVLVGILLLQGSLCDGTTGGAPCVASCDRTTAATVDHHAVLTLDAPDPAGEPDGLVSLCVTVLLAVLLAAGTVRRAELSLPTPRSRRAPARAADRPRALSLPQLCALRL